MSDVPAIGEIESPQFCPWCGAPSPYTGEARVPLWQQAADESGTAPPQAMEDALHTESYVTGCPGCRRVTHVIGHRAG